MHHRWKIIGAILVLVLVVIVIIIIVAAPVSAKIFGIPQWNKFGYGSCYCSLQDFTLNVQGQLEAHFQVIGLKKSICRYIRP